MKTIFAQNSKQLADIFSRYRVTSAYCFGSYAQGKTHKNSDIDIAVRFSKKLTFKQTLSFVNDLSQIFDHQIDLLNLDEASLPLQFRVYKERQLMYSRDIKKELELRNRALLLYYDYKYYYDRFTNFEIDRILTKGFV